MLYETLSSDDYVALTSDQYAALLAGATIPAGPYKFIITRGWTNGRNSLSSTRTISCTGASIFDAVVPHDVEQGGVAFGFQFTIDALVGAFILSKAPVTILFFSEDNMNHTTLELAANAAFVWDTISNSFADFGDGLNHDVGYIEIVPHPSIDTTVNFRLLMNPLVAMQTP